MRTLGRLALLLALIDQPAIDPVPAPVRIDVVIGDVRWKPIPGLRPSDIEVVEDGVARKVESADLRGVLRRTSADTSPIRTAADEERVAREPGARTFIFLLDEFHVSPGQSAERARLWMADFIDAKVFERDLAVVVRPLDPVRSARFTRDHSELHGAVAGFSGRKGEYEPRTPLEERVVGRDPAIVHASRRRIVLDQLNDVAARFAGLKADRPVVVIVSEGFPASEPELEPFLRATSALHLIVYTINPALPAEDVAGPAERDAARAMRQRLASASGGLAVDGDEIIMGFARVAHDSESYWTLTYRPQRTDGAFHAIEVRAKVPGAKVRAPSMYWASPASEWRAPASSSWVATESRPRRRLRRTTVIEVWTGVAPGPDDGARMVVTWEPRTIGERAPHTVVIRARALDGGVLFDGAIARAGTPSGAEQDHARFSVPAGRIELDLTVLDAAGLVIDTDARDVDVPNLRTRIAGPVLFTTEIVRARNNRELEKLTASPGSTPAALRTFARQESLLIRVPALDASGSAVRVTARLLNQAGAPIRDLDAVGGAPVSWVTQFALPLQSLASGQYVIELRGTNPNGSVSDRLPFRVAG